MSHIVFSEGMHDAHFMCMVLNKCLPDPRVDWFLAESLDDDSTLRPKEEEVIREFIYRRDSGHLVKSEEGIGNLIRLFAYYCDDQLLEKFEVTFVADLDNRGIDDLIRRMRDKLENYYRDQIQLPSYSQEATAGDLTTWIATLSAPDMDVSLEFTMITFDEDLEEAADVSYSDSWYQRSIDLNNYASSSPVQQAVCRFFG